jgi:hypothetical protein
VDGGGVGEEDKGTRGIEATINCQTGATLFADAVTKQWLSSCIQFTNVITVRRMSQDTSRKAKEMSFQLPESSVIKGRVAPKPLETNAGSMR